MMTKLIKFNVDCFNGYDGTNEELQHILSQIADLCESEDLLIENASSITFNSGGFDRVIEINLGDK